MTVGYRTAGGRHRAPPAVAEVARLRHEAARLRAEVADLVHRLEAEHHAAHHDELTGLPNRRAFYACAADLLASRRSAAVMLVDLDDFKQINDTLGHGAGDEVLVAVAERLTSLGSEGWLLARLGGDEFAALWTGSVVGFPLEPAAAALATSLGAPMSVTGRTVRVRASIGLAATATPATLAEVLSRADAALYRSKSAGKPVLWEPARDDDTGFRAGARPPVRTRDLRDIRVGPASNAGHPGGGHPQRAGNRVRAAVPVR